MVILNYISIRYCGDYIQLFQFRSNVPVHLMSATTAITSQSIISIIYFCTYKHIYIIHILYINKYL